MIDYTNIPRDSRRVPLRTRVQFKFDRFSGFLSEYSANISPGGMFLRTHRPRPPGTVLDLEFRLGDGFELIKGRGEVIWVRDTDEDPSRPAGMGIRFLELSEGSRELIYRIVDEHVQQGGTPFDVSQRPPDPLPAPPAVSPGLAELFDVPAAPAPRRREPDLPSSAELFSQTSSATPAAQPAAPAPMFAPTFGSASLHRPPRRILPWVLSAVVVILAAGALLFGERLLQWTGLGGKKTARPVSAAPGRASARLPKPATPQGVAAAPAAGGAATATPSSFSAAQPDSGPPLTVLEQITWEPVAGGTDIILWGNGSIPPESYTRSRIEGNPPRELIRLAGVHSPKPQSRIIVGTPEVLQVRIGYHPEAGKGELHVVLDIAHPEVAITGIQREPNRLRLHLQRRAAGT
jgi:uncharacterized protein (TIGR02266 family)